ncbi:alpha/beta fold hydrolase, partial [Methylobacterium variabile]|uniref:alpha/beta fold hydrolase n=1 Tax=Methylobacterium variabile TaxID=298794 RepID=UPI000B07BF38
MIPLAKHLAPHFEVYAPDLPGFGLSDKPRRALTVRELADALAAFMTAIGMKRAAFVGNSLGCEVLVELALVHPQLVDRLVLQGPTPDPEARNLFRQVIGFLAIAPFERWSLAWVAFSDYARAGIGRYIMTLRSMVDNRIGEKALRVEQPTLVVWGTRDYIVPHAFVVEPRRLPGPGAVFLSFRGGPTELTTPHPGAVPRRPSPRSSLVRGRCLPHGAETRRSAHRSAYFY